MMKYICILLLAFVAVHADTNTSEPTFGPIETPGTISIQANLFNGGVSLKGNQSYTVWTIEGFSLLVKTNADVKLSIDVSAKFTGLPKGFQQIQFANIGLQVGLQVKASVDGAITAISVSSPPLPAFIGNPLANGFNQGVLALDQRTGNDIFSALSASYDQNTKKISVTLPVSLPIIVFATIQSQVTAELGSPYQLIAGANQTIQWDAKTAITFRSQVANQITVVKRNYTTRGAEVLRRAGTPLGVFLDITLSNQTAIHDSIIRIAYTAADLLLANIQKAENLKLAVYNEITKNWDSNFPCFVNLTGMYVEAKTPHFSEWTVVDASTAQAQNGVSNVAVSMVSFIVTIITLLVVRQ